MASYRRVLALVALNADPDAVATRAMEMARFHGATLALAAVVDYAPGFEADHVPFRTPEQLRQAIVDDVAAKLDAMVVRLGSGEVIVTAGKDSESVEAITRSWQPDLVLVSSAATHGLDPQRQAMPFDVLIVQRHRPGYVGRLIHALSFPF